MSEFLILAAGILWGTMGIFVKQITVIGFSPVEASALRWIFASLIISIYALIFNRGSLIIKPKDIWKFALIGVFSTLLMSSLFYISITYTSIAVSDILMYTSPVWVQIASVIFFKEKLKPKKVVCVLLAFFGCVFVSGIFSAGKITVSGLGIICGLGAGISYASYSIAGKYMLKKYSDITLTVYNVIFAGIAAIFTINPCKLIDKLIIKPMSVIYIFAIAILCTVVPYFLYTVGLKCTEASRAAIICCIEPIVATVGSIFIAHEFFSVFQAIGVGLVVLSVVLLQIKNKEEAK